MKRTKFTPEAGRTYRNAGGWTFTAIGCGIYEDGTIDWDYSGKDGRFEGVPA